MYFIGFRFRIVKFTRIVCIDSIDIYTIKCITFSTIVSTVSTCITLNVLYCVYNVSTVSTSNKNSTNCIHFNIIFKSHPIIKQLTVCTTLQPPSPWKTFTDKKWALKNIKWFNPPTIKLPTDQEVPTCAPYFSTNFITHTGLSSKISFIPIWFPPYPSCQLYIPWLQGDLPGMFSQ